MIDGLITIGAGTRAVAVADEVEHAAVIGARAAATHSVAFSKGAKRRGGISWVNTIGTVLVIPMPQESARVRM